MSLLFEKSNDNIWIQNIIPIDCHSEIAFKIHFVDSDHINLPGESIFQGTCGPAITKLITGLVYLLIHLDNLWSLDKSTRP